jgi:hypothetical protein
MVEVEMGKVYYNMGKRNWDSQSRPVVIQPGTEPGSGGTPLALRCSVLDRCATQEPSNGFNQYTLSISLLKMKILKLTEFFRLDVANYYKVEINGFLNQIKHSDEESNGRTFYGVGLESMEMYPNPAIS